MKYLEFIFFAIFILCINSCCSHDDRIFGTIEGTIIDINAKPVEGANVLLIIEGSSIITKSDGVFRFDKLNEGLYDIYVSKTGYVDNKIQIEVLSGEIKKTNITLFNDN